MVKVVFIPGNGGGTTQDNWFPSIKHELEVCGLTVIAKEFPDSDLARASFWLPFLLDEIKVDDETILVGHSSGAIAAMRVAEIRSILGSVLVGAYHTHLNMDTEKLSGYFDKPWNWHKIKQNQKWISIFASQDDPWIPIEEARYLRDQLNCEYHEYKQLGHFGGDYYKSTFPEITNSIMQNLRCMDNVILRQASNFDSQFIRKLLFEIWVDELDLEFQASDFPDLYDIDKHYTLNGGLFLVALINDRIVGAIAYDKFNVRQLAIKRLCVDKRYRRLGIAQLLLDQLLQQVDHKDSLFLSTKDNASRVAKKFYQKNGFTIIDKSELPQNFPFFYSDNLFMMKNKHE